MIWQMSRWGRFWRPFSKAVLFGGIAAFATVYFLTLAGFVDPLRLTVTWVVFGVVTALLWLSRSLKLVTAVSVNEANGIDLQVGWSTVSIPHEEISAIIAIAGTEYQGGTNLVWRGNWLISPQGRWRILSSPDGSAALFAYFRIHAPFAWMLPIEGEPLPPSEVADQIHSNAPEKVLGRIRAQLVRMMIGRVTGALVIATLTGLIVWGIFNAKRGGRGVIWAFFLGLSAYAYLRSAGHVWSQYRMLTLVERQLLGL